MSFRIRARKSAAQEVTRVAGDRLDQALHALREGTAEGVHDARKRLKETRALLRLVRQPLGEAFAEHNHRLRDIGRALSEQRDAAAMVESWDALVAGDQRRLSTPAMKRVRARLLARTHDDAEPQDRAELEACLQNARDTLAKLPLTRKDFSLFAAGVRRSYRDGRKALRRVESSPGDEVLHDWRKRVKDHWYQTRLLRDAWPKLFAARAKSLKQLADWLGDDHDLAVMQALLAEQPALFGALQTRRAIEDAIAMRRAQLRERALLAGARLYAEKPRQRVRRWKRLWQITRQAAPALRDAAANA